jgi:cell division protein FtsB
MPRRANARLTLRELGKIALLSAVVVWLGVLVVGIFRKEEVARGKVGETRTELAALDARKQALADTVHDLSTERGKEASVRETFGVAKPGEEVIVVMPKTESPPPPEPTFWQKVKAFFKK